MADARTTAGMLAVAACAAIFVLVGPASWPLVVSWLAATGLIALIWQHLAPFLKLALAITFVPLCILLTFEGGLFFLPAAAASIVAAMAERHRAAV